LLLIKTGGLVCSALCLADRRRLDFAWGKVQPARALQMYEAKLEVMGDFISLMRLKLCLFSWQKAGDRLVQRS